MKSPVRQPKGLEALYLMVIAIAMIWAGQVSAEVKSDSLQFLQQLRTQNVKRLQEIDQTLQKTVETSRASELEKSIESLRLAKNEHLLREELLNRLIFQIDTRFGGGDLRDFLGKALNKMAAVDATSTNESGLLKFFKYCSEAINGLPEKNENILAFVEGYMNRSISNPMLPQEYLAQRNYTNGSVSETGSPMSREDAGAVADERTGTAPVRVQTN